MCNSDIEIFKNYFRKVLEITNVNDYISDFFIERYLNKKYNYSYITKIFKKLIYYKKKYNAINECELCKNNTDNCPMCRSDSVLIEKFRSRIFQPINDKDSKLKALKRSLKRYCKHDKYNFYKVFIKECDYNPNCIHYSTYYNEKICYHQVKQLHKNKSTVEKYKYRKPI